MEAIESLFAWVGANEAVLSGLAAAIVIVGVLVAPLGAWTRAYRNRRRARRGTTSGAAPGAEPPRMVREQPSIAVLPFANLSGDPEHAYLADGLAEDILTGLSRIKQLFVIARASSFTYRERAVDARDVSAELGVRYVLEGSVRPVGERIRVTAQLVDATTRQHVWAERYDRPLSQIFEVQDEVTESIVAALQPALRKAEAERARRRPPESLDAWASVNRALCALQGDLGNRAAAREQLEPLRRAVALSPDYALAHAVLGLALSLSEERVALPPARVEESLAEARRGVELDADDALVLHCYGATLANLGRTQDAVRAYEAGLAIDPNSAQTQAALGIALIYIRRPEDALEHIDRALRRSPRDPLLYHWLAERALALAVLGRFEGAAADARASVERRATRTGRVVHALSLARLGRVEEAREAFRELLPLVGDTTLSDWERFVLHLTRSREEAEPLIDGLRTAAGDLAPSVRGEPGSPSQ